MCKSHTIKYNCTHTIKFRTSTCRGSYGARPHADRLAAGSFAPLSKVACMGGSTLTFVAQSACGSCCVKEGIAKGRSGTVLGFDGQNDGADSAMKEKERHAALEWSIRRLYPDPLNGKIYKRPTRNEKTLGLSPLSNEVLAEDIEEPYDFESGGWGIGGSGTGWLTRTLGVRDEGSESSQTQGWECVDDTNPSWEPEVSEDTHDPYLRGGYSYLRQVFGSDEDCQGLQERPFRVITTRSKVNTASRPDSDHAGIDYIPGTNMSRMGAGRDVVPVNEGRLAGETLRVRHPGTYVKHQRPDENTAEFRKKEDRGREIMA